MNIWWVIIEWYRAYPKQSAYLIQSDIQYLTSESLIMAPYSSDMLSTHIEYHSANLYHTYTMYNLADICWDVLNNIISLYYLRIQPILGLNCVVTLYMLLSTVLLVHFSAYHYLTALFSGHLQHLWTLLLGSPSNWLYLPLFFWLKILLYALAQTILWYLC